MNGAFPLTAEQRLDAALRKVRADAKATKREGCAELLALTHDPKVGTQARDEHRRHCGGGETWEAPIVRRLRAELRDRPIRTIYDKRLPSLLSELAVTCRSGLPGAYALQQEASQALAGCLTNDATRLSRLRSNFEGTCNDVLGVVAIAQPLRAFDPAIEEPLAKWRTAAEAAIKRTAEARINEAIDCNILGRAVGVLSGLHSFEERVRERDSGFTVLPIIDRLTEQINSAQEEYRRLAAAIERLREPPKTWEEARAFDAALGSVDSWVSPTDGIPKIG